MAQSAVLRVPKTGAPGGQTIKATLPPPVNRQFSFTSNSVNNPNTQQPGDRMDAEYDRTNNAVNTLTGFCSVTFNTDGTLKPGSVGEPQLDPNIATEIANDIIAEVQPLVDQAQSYAGSAFNSSSSAIVSASGAAASASQAAASATDAQSAAGGAQASASTASLEAAAAGNYAANAENYANAAYGNANLCIDYGVVTQAWAEHMPDTIPPNILAVMNITGDHWSSRWWAHQAEIVVDGALGAIQAAGSYWVSLIEQTGSAYIEMFQTLYLGAFYYPPSTDAQGNPIATGAIYYNLLLNAPYVWNGTQWVPFLTPGPPDVTRYIYVATAGQTLFSGPDRDGNVLTFSAADHQRSQVFQKGDLLTPTNDYTEGVNEITFTKPAAAGDIVQIFVTVVPVIALNWNTLKLDTSGWTPSGGVLKDMQGHPVVVADATDVWVSVDGVWQEPFKDYFVSSSVITFPTPALPDGKVFAIAIVPTAGTVPGAAVTKLNTSSWVFNGVNVTFPLLDQNGTLVNTQAVNLLLSLNGVWQNALVDYTVTNAYVTFTTPPDPDAYCFALSGLPSFTGTA